MKYYSTRSRSNPVSVSVAVSRGLADDGGLYMPEEIPVLPDSFFGTTQGLSLAEIGAEVLAPYFAPDIPRKVLEEITKSAFDFPVPLKQITERISALELFHGPTLAFKDFGARFLARALAHVRRNASRELWVLVATSGDTGSAVASGFHRVPGIRVFVLYPSGKVSRLQEAQMTTLGENVTALELDGTFDDCQRLVKTAFVDPDLREKRELTSANSINLGRLLPQMLYYFSAVSDSKVPAEKLVVSVPCGNLGNLSAGVIARRMGLDIGHFVAASNANDAFPRYLATGEYQPRPSISTVSNAMDVGNPSNMDRLLELYGSELEEMQAEITGSTFTDADTVSAITKVDREHRYILDPHGAVAYLGLEQRLQSDASRFGILLETAHPAKFEGTVHTAIGRPVELPPALSECLTREKQTIRMGTDFREFKQFLLG
ncbi:MAG: threonine synthase [Bdellovibrionota bacterium]